MPTYRLTVEYDGSKFHGWQIQPHGRTVQGTLIDALRRLGAGDDLVLQGAGRTDAGVHALAQVASLRCPNELAVATVLRALEQDLPADLAVLDLRRVADGFHARHDAEARAYRYQISQRRSAFGKRVTWWVDRPLDPARMASAGRWFVGRHDFRAFTRQTEPGASTIVVVESCEVAAIGPLIMIRVVASHFLWAQVRRMVGALVAVGSGEAAVADVDAWLDGDAPAPARAAPAAGLFLEAVRYPGDPWELPPLGPLAVPAGPPASNLSPAGPGAAARRSRR